ncbi:MAG: DUF3617 family protein [Sphingomonas sp.]|uniref:DUF3617 domain-containing protein n=1 Tax=Sphingomonas sp. TaxID=28214 RepID=UPI001B112AAC|nr:DUF3617 family protein [Sphingomonas sp.]MBO9624417.1 DUF3617 family protein [Sphingomonas sp.]
MRAVIALALILPALSACQSAEEKRAAETGEIQVSDATSAQVSKLMKAAQAKRTMKPGEWRLELHVLSADTGSGPLAADDPKMVQLKGQERSTTACRGAKDLKAIDLEQLEKVAGECRFPRYSLVGGQLDAEIECKQPNGAAMHITAHGTTANDRFDVTLDQRSGTAGQPGYLALQLRAQGTRLGECKG